MFSIVHKKAKSGLTFLKKALYYIVFLELIQRDWATMWTKLAWGPKLAYDEHFFSSVTTMHDWPREEQAFYTNWGTKRKPKCESERSAIHKCVFYSEL